MEYINMLRNTPLDKRYYEEIKAIKSRDWQFLEKRDSFEECENIAAIFGKIQNENLLSWAYKMGEWCPEKISFLISHLTWDNSNMHCRPMVSMKKARRSSATVRSSLCHLKLRRSLKD